MKDERMFPILGGPYRGLPRSVPWRLLAAQERQALDNHDQTLKRLAERGGLSPAELLAVLRGERWSKRTFQSDKLASVELARLLKADADDASHQRGLAEGRAERDAELRRAMDVVDAAIAWQEDTGGCHFCGFGLSQGDGRAIQSSPPHDDDCPLVANGFITPEGTIT